MKQSRIFIGGSGIVDAALIYNITPTGMDVKGGVAACLSQRSEKVSRATNADASSTAA